MSMIIIANGKYKVKHMTPEERRAYYIWKNMKDRCTRFGHTDFKRYAGRGIGVYPKWMHDFAKFITDVGIPASSSVSLDRWPNNNGNYEPGNVRWATQKQQMLNQSKNRPITIDGVTKMMTEWADEYGIDRASFHYRLKVGWTGDKLLSSPRAKILVTIDGITKPAVQWARQIPMCLTGFMHRVSVGETGPMLLRPSQKIKPLDPAQAPCA